MCLNLLRAFGAGLVWAVVAYGLGASWTVIMAIVPICPIVHLIIGMPLGVAAYASEGSFGGPIAVAMLPGDPLLYLVSRVFPRSFPIQGLHLFQMTPVLLLTRALNGDREMKGCEVSSISGDGSGFVE